MSYSQPPNQYLNNPFKDQDLEELIKNCLPDKPYHLDKATKRILLEFAQTFLEEALDLTPSEKSNLNCQAIKRQLAIKFPEVARNEPSIEMLQKRNNEIDKEDML